VTNKHFLEDVSVAIPTIGRTDMLKKCLESIAAGETLPGEVLILDQSQESAVSNLASEFSDIQIRVVTCEGKGIARNMNLALKNSKTDRVLVTHDDCVVDCQWVKNGASALKANPNGIVTGPVLPGGGDPKAVPSTINRGAYIDFTGTLMHGALYPNNMGLHCSSALEIGGFDERKGFHTAAEDLDFSYRWLRSKRTMKYIPEMSVTHNDWREPSELSGLYKHYARCAGRFYGKHLITGDAHIAKQVAKDIRKGVLAWRSKLVSGTPRWQDELLELPFWVPIGVIEGIFESVTIRLRSRISNKSVR